MLFWYEACKTKKIQILIGAKNIFNPCISFDINQLTQDKSIIGGHVYAYSRVLCNSTQPNLRINMINSSKVGQVTYILLNINICELTFL